MEGRRKGDVVLLVVMVCGELVSKVVFFLWKATVTRSSERYPSLRLLCWAWDSWVSGHCGDQVCGDVAITVRTKLASHFTVTAEYKGIKKLKRNLYNRKPEISVSCHYTHCH